MKNTKYRIVTDSKSIHTLIDVENKCSISRNINKGTLEAMRYNLVKNNEYFELAEA